MIPGSAPSPSALIAVGGAAAGHADVARAGRWRDVGPDPWGPPAAAAGYAALAADRGRLGRERLACARDRALAVDGLRVGRGVHAAFRGLAADLVAEMHPDGCIYYPDGRADRARHDRAPVRPGDVLREWVGRGAALLGGPVGDAIAREIAARGGALTADDFELATADMDGVRGAAAGGARSWATPAPTHGPGLLVPRSPTTRRRRMSRSPASTAAVMAAIERQRRELGDPGGTSMVSAGRRVRDGRGRSCTPTRIRASGAGSSCRSTR